jgi:hypothetical protein
MGSRVGPRGGLDFMEKNLLLLSGIELLLFVLPSYSLVAISTEVFHIYRKINSRDLEFWSYETGLPLPMLKQTSRADGTKLLRGIFSFLFFQF